MYHTNVNILLIVEIVTRKMWNICICRSECKKSKKHRVCGKDYIWNPATCGYEGGEYVGNIDLLISCDETIDY